MLKEPQKIEEQSIEFLESVAFVWIESGRVCYAYVWRWYGERLNVVRYTRVYLDLKIFTYECELAHLPVAFLCVYASFASCALNGRSLGVSGKY